MLPQHNACTPEAKGSIGPAIKLNDKVAFVIGRAPTWRGASAARGWSACRCAWMCPQAHSPKERAQLGLRGRRFWKENNLRSVGECGDKVLIRVSACTLVLRTGADPWNIGTASDS